MRVEEVIGVVFHASDGEQTSGTLRAMTTFSKTSSRVEIICLNHYYVHYDESDSRLEL